MDETPSGPWYAVTPLRAPDEPGVEPRSRGAAADRFPFVRRFRELVDGDRAWVADRPEWRLRAEIGTFLDRCGRVGLGDVPAGELTEAGAHVRHLRTDPTQHRAGTEVERRALVAVDRLAPGLRDDELEHALETVAAEVLGYVVPGEWPFELICWSAATTLLDGVDTPFVLAHRVVHAAVFDPPDPDGLLAPLTELRDRWWHADGLDQPELADGIRAVFAHYAARAPYPR